MTPAVEQASANLQARNEALSNKQDHEPADDDDDDTDDDQPPGYFNDWDARYDREGKPSRGGPPTRGRRVFHRA
ncbi:hypothetical protein PspLS_00276 [Pyricularia sp. CBS 133598]|nr:hypothetical protein PspLS_00276 [Pyricularia sp. CBS 133598]